MKERSLLDPETRQRLPDLNANEALGMDAQAQAKFYAPDMQRAWYASEFDGDDIFFGLVDGHVVKLGYFSLSYLEQIRGPMGLPIERDFNFIPQPLKELNKRTRESRR